MMSIVSEEGSNSRGTGWEVSGAEGRISGVGGRGWGQTVEGRGERCQVQKGRIGGGGIFASQGSDPLPSSEGGKHTGTLASEDGEGVKQSRDGVRGVRCKGAYLEKGQWAIKKVSDELITSPVFACM